ncbi:MAG TPA: hypothetical protein VM580_21135, partial [Labilithrix sp.]|nr:hypothetical protein [Labilithrix sp.]
MELHGCTEEPEPEDFVCDSCRIKELESANIQLRERLQEMSDELDKLKTPRPPVSEVPNKVTRNMSTPEARAFWESAERSAEEVASWPDWKRAGINVSSKRSEPRPSEACPMNVLDAARSLVEYIDKNKVEGELTPTHWRKVAELRGALA